MKLIVNLIGGDQLEIEFKPGDNMKDIYQTVLFYKDAYRKCVSDFNTGKLKMGNPLLNGSVGSKNAPRSPVSNNHVNNIGNNNYSPSRPKIINPNSPASERQVSMLMGKYGYPEDLASSFTMQEASDIINSNFGYDKYLETENGEM